MKLTLEPTQNLVHVNGALCREWKGTDSAGHDVIAYIASLKGHDLDKLSDGMLFETDAPLEARHE